MNFFGTLDECEKNFHELKKSVVELVLALNPHGVRHLKASTFLDISVLGKLLPPSCIRCMSWNPEASYKKLKNLGRTHGKRLDLTKLKELGQGLTAVFDIVLKEAKNIVCEDCNESPGVDVIFDGQQMCCVINVKVRWTMGSQNLWSQKGTNGELGNDLQDTGYLFETPLDFPIQREVPDHGQKGPHNKRRRQKGNPGKVKAPV